MLQNFQIFAVVTRIHAQFIGFHYVVVDQAMNFINLAFWLSSFYGSNDLEIVGPILWREKYLVTS